MKNAHNAEEIVLGEPSIDGRMQFKYTLFPKQQPSEK
jgi:hypothetical protein